MKSEDVKPGMIVLTPRGHLATVLENTEKTYPGGGRNGGIRMRLHHNNASSWGLSATLRDPKEKPTAAEVLEATLEAFAK